MKALPNISVIIPCLNEEESIAKVVLTAKKALAKMKVKGEVIVVDNNSTDNSARLAKKAGATVFLEKQRGYGSAYLRGFSEAKGDYLIMGDADATYDFADIPKLIKPLNNGFDLVIGSRLLGNIKKGAMPWSHRYIGTPILSFMLKLFFGGRIVDAQSGYRAITKEAFNRLKVNTTGMEFASEMIIKSLQKNLKIKEIPIDYHPRIGDSKLRSFKDAWRHIRFMLLYSPTALFFTPGVSLFLIGLLILLALLNGPIIILGRLIDIHVFIIGALLLLLGYQLISFGLFSKTYAYISGFTEDSIFSKYFYTNFKLEHGLLIGAVITLFGLLINVYILFHWMQTGFGALNQSRLVLFGAVWLLVGIQTIFTSFLLGIFSIKHK